MRTYNLAPPIVFDNDCIASFLWVNRLDIVLNLFESNVAVPQQVFDELRFLKGTKYCRVFEELDKHISAGMIDLIIIDACGPEAPEYFGLTSGTSGLPAMGKGESAVLSYVKCWGGTVASNNLSDVHFYCLRFNLELIRTDDILCLGLKDNLLSYNECDYLWNEMKSKKRKLPPYDFKEVWQKFKSA